MSGSRSGKPLRLFYLFSVVQNPIIKTVYSRIPLTGSPAVFYVHKQRCFILLLSTVLPDCLLCLSKIV